MNGTKYLFDTNALISFLQGNPNLQNFSTPFVYLSVISVVEFLSFSGLYQEEKDLLDEFIKNVEIIDLNNSNATLTDIIINLRHSYKIKLPDAIIAGTAIYKNAVLITNDKDFARIDSLSTQTY